MAASELTRGQQLIWVGQQLYPDRPLYNMALLFWIDSELCADSLRQAFASIVARSDALSTSVMLENDVPKRVVRDSMQIEIPLVEFSDTADPEQAARIWAEERARRLLDVSKCLFDSAILRMSRDRHAWFLNIHHLATDGWSSGVVLREVGDAYRRIQAGEQPLTDPLPRFAAYADFEKRASETPRYDQAVSFWQEHLADQGGVVEFYDVSLESPAISPDSDRVALNLGCDRSDRLRELAQDPSIRSLTPGLTMFNLFATVLLATLHRLSEARRLVIGSPVHNRPTAELKNTIGVLIELFPLQVETNDTETLRSLLEKVKKESATFLRYAQPAVSHSLPRRSFNVVMNYINVSLGGFADLPTRTEWIHPGCSDAAHHLRVMIHDFDATGDFRLLFDINRAVFPGVHQKWFIDHYLSVLDGLLENLEQPVQQIALGPYQEPIAADSHSSSCCDSVIEAFDKQVAESPDAVAVVAQGRRHTYRELSDRSHTLASRLRGLARGERVAILTDRSVETIVAILGTMRAGGAYLPIDAAQPPARIAEMLRDGDVRNALVSPASLAERLPDQACHVMVVEDLPDLPPAESPTLPQLDPGDLAYVIYTSGSTGKPNGVQVEHRNVLSLVRGLQERIYDGYQGPLNVALVASLQFDASVQQIFAALLQGHALHLVPEDSRADGNRLVRFFQEHAIDVSDGTPAHLQLMAETDGAECDSLPHLIIGGDKLSPSVVQAFKTRFPRCSVRITNIYGVAECCVDSCSYEIGQSENDAAERFPIGTALVNSELLVLNKHRQLQPDGVMGEIAIGGEGVSRGYLNRPELNSARFIEHPWRAGQRLYLTGDLGRYREDGNLEFIGRRDGQVKIRGHRIELGDIEHSLREFRSDVKCALPILQSSTVQATRRCEQCLITDRHPNVTFDSDGICSVCKEFEGYRSIATSYFQSLDEFRELLAGTTKSGEFDCLLLYSGGKDSSYVLYRLVEMGLKILAFTFDNGFISPTAFRNIKRQTSRLGVECIIQKTPSMPEIFVESLQQDHTVCSGCFRALTTLSTRLAHERGIRVVVTGLSRGQIFDTKLVGLLRQGVRDVVELESHLGNFRRLFHANTDRTARLLNDDLADVSFENMHFVDFFRYDDTPVSQVRDYLATRDDFWRQPEDTGFCSSNCMMNDVGIRVHQNERGYHNYDAPLSWDIRLKVSSRQEVIGEVDEAIDEKGVEKILDGIGYFRKRVTDARVLVDQAGDGHRQLVAYFAASQPISPKELKAHLSQLLPAYMIPSRYVQLEQMPLTVNGKVDDRALREQQMLSGHDESPHDPPEGPIEEALVEIWQDVLGVERVGRLDDFFDLGGDSIRAMQIVSRINRRFEIAMSLVHTLDASTVARVAEIVEEHLLDSIEALSDEEARKLAALPDEPQAGGC